MKPTSTETFRKLLSDFDAAVLVTHGTRTHFQARPMVIAKVDSNCDLWFITSAESAKVHEIEADTRVQVICQNGRSRCLSIAGHASLVRNRETIRELWNPMLLPWFPAGAEDPDLVLIKVEGEHAEFWDNSGFKGLTYLYQTIKAVATGSTPKVEEGRQHGEVNLALERERD